jgi:hypothetical protein
LLIQQSHHEQRLRADRARLVRETATVKAQQFALAGDAEGRPRRLDQTPFLLKGVVQIFF